MHFICVRSDRSVRFAYREKRTTLIIWTYLSTASSTAFKNGFIPVTVSATDKLKSRRLEVVISLKCTKHRNYSKYISKFPLRILMNKARIIGWAWIVSGYSVVIFVNKDKTRKSSCVNARGIPPARGRKMLTPPWLDLTPPGWTDPPPAGPDPPRLDWPPLAGPDPPPTWTWPPWLDWPPPRLDLTPPAGPDPPGWTDPPPQLDLTPPSRCEQSENITFPILRMRAIISVKQWIINYFNIGVSNILFNFNGGWYFWDWDPYRYLQCVKLMLTDSFTQ